MIAWAIGLGILVGSLVSGDHSLLVAAGLFAVAGNIGMAKFK